MKNRINTAVAIHLIFMDMMNAKVLITRRHNTGYQDGMWQFPTGHVEMGELPSEAAIREAKEEVGVKLKHFNLHQIHTLAQPKHDDTGNWIHIFYLVRGFKVADIRNTEPKKCSATKWINLFKFPKNTTPHVKKGFLDGFGDRLHYSEMTLKEMHSLPQYGLE